ncbi:hypothetical protein MAN88_36980 [Microcystis aeruginosa]|nr:hypothetical protein MAN88_36980 [Microcystis aeruginosa]
MSQYVLLPIQVIQEELEALKKWSFIIRLKLRVYGKML